MNVQYLTDGEHLYEVAVDRIDRNYGIGGTLLRAVTVQDAATSEQRVLTGPRIETMRRVDGLPGV